MFTFTNNVISISLNDPTNREENGKDKIKSNVVRTAQVYSDASFSFSHLEEKRYGIDWTSGFRFKRGFRFVYTHTQGPIIMQCSTLWYSREFFLKKKHEYRCCVWHSLAPAHTTANIVKPLKISWLGACPALKSASFVNMLLDGIAKHLLLFQTNHWLAFVGLDPV